ncbi:GAF domain-containing protein [Nocardia sp. NPDC051832]|uniref:GAF domain-containing protein n=1 Tax=Nocardia sp. NPDC051832 TaxID=3155673 RepID=UPI003441B4D6
MTKQPDSADARRLASAPPNGKDPSWRPYRPRTSKDWVVVEMLDDWSEPTVVVDGQFRREFSALKRISIAPNTAIAERVKPLLIRCGKARTSVVDNVTLRSGTLVKLVARPVYGISGEVRGATVWAGPEGERPPRPPQVGVLEWNTHLVASMSPTARAMLHGDSKLDSLLLPELIAAFDRFEDRAGFLSLFSLMNPVAKWTGAATRTYGDGTVHQLHLAARTPWASASTVRALVCDVGQERVQPGADLYEAVLRCVPILPGHALGIVDLDAMAVHDWVANNNEPIAGWLHHQPRPHPEDLVQVVELGRDLLNGTRTRARFRSRIRFDDNDDWITVECTWHRLPSGAQRQALIDVAIVAPMPASVVDVCPRCKQMRREAC